MIRKMLIDDLDIVDRLEHQLFSHPWTKSDFIFELTSNPFASYWVLLKDDKIVAYIGAWFTDDQAQITTLGVDPEYQRRGYAQQLLHHFFNQCQDQNIYLMSLEVRISNQSAIELYQKHGFKTVSLRKDYYTSPLEDAYLMVKEG